jgi:hypothetical protein
VIRLERSIWGDTRDKWIAHWHCPCCLVCLLFCCTVRDVNKPGILLWILRFAVPRSIFARIHWPEGFWRWSKDVGLFSWCPVKVVVPSDRSWVCGVSMCGGVGMKMKMKSVVWVNFRGRIESHQSLYAVCLYLNCSSFVSCGSRPNPNCNYGQEASSQLYSPPFSNSKTHTHTHTHGDRETETETVTEKVRESWKSFSLNKLKLESSQSQKKRRKLKQGNFHSNSNLHADLISPFAFGILVGRLSALFLVQVLSLCRCDWISTRVDFFSRSSFMWKLKSRRRRKGKESKSKNNFGLTPIKSQLVLTLSAFFFAIFF